MCAGARSQIARVWSSDSSPAANAANTVGRSVMRRAIATNPAARPNASPHRHATQCAGDRSPTPSHHPCANAAAIGGISPAAAALAISAAAANASSLAIAAVQSASGPCRVATAPIPRSYTRSARHHNPDSRSSPRNRRTPPPAPRPLPRTHPLFADRPSAAAATGRHARRGDDQRYGASGRSVMRSPPFNAAGIDEGDATERLLSGRPRTSALRTHADSRQRRLAAEVAPLSADRRRRGSIRSAVDGRAEPESGDPFLLVP